MKTGLSVHIERSVSPSPLVVRGVSNYFQSKGFLYEYLNFTQDWFKNC